MFYIKHLIILNYLLFFVLLISYPSWGSYISNNGVTTLFASILAVLVVAYSCLYICKLPMIYCNFNFNVDLTNTVQFAFSFSITPLSFSFSYLVLLIAFSTNIYILNYFKNEANETLFVFFINIFVLSMLILLLANNFFTLFVGWELIGLSSFFLINFWTVRRGTLKSSFKAFTFNLFSDSLLLTTLTCFYYEQNTLDCELFLYLITNQENSLSTTVYIGATALIVCAGIKSVQVVGHLWLPDSMEAPVPASALIHSATLVSAGLYLICKFNTLYILLNTIGILTLVGAITSAYGGIVAAAQTDLKKILAYSTMSHCGFLWVLAINENLYIMLLYLFLHGFFKATTFFCVGSFIYNYGSQDTRLMGSASVFFPLDSILLIICSANLAGLPLLIGYLYKVYFLKILVFNIGNFLAVGFLICGLLSSVVYFFKLTHFVVFDFNKNIEFTSLYMLLVTKCTTFKLLRFVNFNHICATSFLCFITFFLYNYFYWLLNTLSFNSNPSLFGWELTVIELETFFITYYVYTYIYYACIIMALILYRGVNSVYMIEINLISIFFFIAILLKCEVISWRKVAA